MFWAIDWPALRPAAATGTPTAPDSFWEIPWIEGMICNVA